MKHLKIQFDLHTNLFNNCLNGLSQEDAWVRPNDDTNPIIWMAGHLVGTRMQQSRVGGFEPDPQFDSFFGHDQQLDMSKTYPSLQHIKEAWNEISPKISAGFWNMTEEALAGPAPMQLPVADDTLGGFYAFIMHHEAYHIGQMGILRKYVSNKAMSYDVAENV